MPSWSTVVADTFNRADGAVGNGWSNTTHGVSAILSNRLTLTTATFGFPDGGIVYTTSPGAEARVVYTFKGTVTPTTNADTAPLALLRSNGSDRGGTTAYAVWFGSNLVNVSAWVAGSRTDLTQFFTAGAVAINFAHDLQLDYSATGVNPTIHTVTLTDLTTSTVLINAQSFSETTSLVPATTGKAGIAVATFNTFGTIALDDVTIYTGVFGLAHLYQSTGTPPTATTLTADAAWTGGTPNYTILLERSADAGATWATADSGSQAGTTYTFGDTGLTPGTVYLYRLTVTDAGSTSIAFTRAMATLRTAVPVLFVGDSIYNQGVVSGAFVTAVTALVPQAKVTEVNAAVSGTTSNDWRPSVDNSGIYTAALAAGTGAGSTTCLVMLGANDADSGVSVATYLSHMTELVAGLVANGYTVYLNAPGTPTVGPLPAGGGNANAAALLLGYAAALLTLVNGTTVRRGDQSGPALFAINAAVANFAADDVHPGSVGGPAQGYLQAAAYCRSSGLLGAIAAGGGLVAQRGFTGGFQ